MPSKQNRIHPQTHPPNNKNAEKTRPVVRSATVGTMEGATIPQALYHASIRFGKEFLKNVMIPFAASLRQSLARPVNDNRPGFCNMLAAQQRSSVEMQILHRMSSLTGKVEDEARYTVLSTAHRGGIRYFDVKAELGIHTLELHLRIANRSCVVDFMDGYKARHMNGHTDCDETYLATSPLRRLSGRFDTETYL